MLNDPLAEEAYQRSKRECPEHGPMQRMGTVYRCEACKALGQPQPKPLPVPKVYDRKKMRYT